MATKIVVGVVAILLLAVTGTVGTVYYHHPDLFECQSAPACGAQEPSSGDCCSQPTSCDAETPACGAATECSGEK